MSEWKKAKIGDICTIEKGSTGIASANPGKFPLVTTGADRKTCTDFQFDTDAVCIPLVSSTGHGKKTLNYVHFQSGKFALGTILAAVIPNDTTMLSARFLHLYLSHFKDSVLVPLMKGAANVSLPIKGIAGIEIPLPPIIKQLSIVDLVERLEGEHGELENEGVTQLTIVRQLRQAILQEAVEGKLSADWRKKNPVRKGDPEYDAGALLEKIMAEKEKLIKEGKIRKEKSLAPIKDEEKPFALPEGWVWCRLGDVSEIKGGKRVSNGYKLLKIPTQHIYIRVSDMKNGTIDDSDLHYINEYMYQKIKRYTIGKNDLYMTIVGATIGKCGIVPDKFDNMNLTENAAKIVLHIIDKTFLFHLLSCPLCQGQFVDKTKQVGVQKMALNRLSTTIIPLPPLAEQRAIVSRVDSLLSTLSALESQITERQTQSEQLMQAVLREAFEVAV